MEGTNPRRPTECHFYYTQDCCNDGRAVHHIACIQCLATRGLWNLTSIHHRNKPFIVNTVRAERQSPAHIGLTQPIT
jgi:hypothetical protein